MSDREASWTKRGLYALGLLAALGFVFSVQYVPHLATFENPPAEGEPGLVRLGTAWVEYVGGDRDGHRWANHADEHLHAARIAQIQRADELVSGAYEEDPEPVNPLGSLGGAIHERGYYVGLAQIQDVTGVSTLSVYQFLPALWTTFLAFGVWAMLRPHPASIPAAAFVALIPSTPRFLGTGYLVPIGFSLAWIPATTILAERGTRSLTAGVLALLVSTWAFFVHLIAGFACVAAFALVAMIRFPQARGHAWKLAALAFVPLAALFRSFWGGVQEAIQREEQLPIDFTIFDNYGVITLFVWAAGVTLLALDPPEERNRGPLWAFGALSLVALSLIIGTVYFDFNKYAMYSRMHMVFFATAVVPAGYVVARLGHYARRTLAVLGERIGGVGSGRAARAGALLVGLLVAVAPLTAAANQAVDYHLDQAIYRVMNEQRWQAFERVDDAYEYEDDPYTVFLTHPWQAPFLAEKTGKVPHAVLFPGSPPVNGEDWDEYLQGDKDLSFFVDNGITLVIGPRPPPGDVWKHDGGGVWVMEEPYAEQVDRLRQGKSLQLDALPEPSSS